MQVRRAAADQSADLRLLHRCEEAPPAGRRSAWACPQARSTPGREALADVEHALARQTNLAADLLVSQAALAQANHLPPTLLLRRGWQAPHVNVDHATNLHMAPSCSKTAQVRINKHMMPFAKLNNVLGFDSLESPAEHANYHPYRWRLDGERCRMMDVTFG